MRVSFATACCVFLAVSPAPAQAPGIAPERLLPADSVAYFRFDGVQTHRQAFEQTAAGELMKGDLGQFLDYLVSLVKDSLGPVLVKGQFLEGIPADQLNLVRNGFNQVPGLVHCLGKHGFVVGVAVADPLAFQAQMTVVFPTGGEAKSRAALVAAFRMAAALNKVSVQERKVDGRTFFEIDPKVTGPVRIALWAEGSDVVFTLGTGDPAQTLGLATGKRPSLQANPLFQALAGFKNYESVARGFVDFERVNKLVGLYPPAAQLVDKLGLTGLKQLKMYFGFEGRHLRGTTVWRLAGPRRGLFEVLKAPAHFNPQQLPPLPPDITSVHAYHLDFGKAYDAVLQALAGISQAAEPDEKQDVGETAKKIDAALGIDLRKDLLAGLGPLAVVYNSPGEGTLSLGYALAIQVQDGPKATEALETLFRSLPAALGTDVKLKKTIYREATIHTLRIPQEGFFFQPSFAVHKGWLVVGMYPQTVQGYILRSSGKFAVWQAPPLAGEVLAAVTKEARAGRVAGLTVSDPRPGLKQLCSLGPFVGGLANSFAPGSFDVAKIPNGQAVTEPLYANVSVLVDDGDGLRTESYASLSLPLIDTGGMDVYFVALFGFQFFRFGF